MLCSRILCSSGEGKAKKKEILHDVTMSGNGGISRLASAGTTSVFSEGQGGQMESFVANNLNATTRRRDNRQQETGGADKAALVAALVLAAVAAALVNNGCRQCWHWRRKIMAKALAVVLEGWRLVAREWQWVALLGADAALRSGRLIISSGGLSKGQKSRGAGRASK